ncbi:hypothetical protein [Roseibium sp.]|uniref:hypothetical protein n=1 Tax=Roseibium sp. TaxID=1936156 RepID=UPI003264D6BC
MPIINTALRSRLTSAVDNVFSERLAVRFWKDGREDPDRPTIEIHAPLRTHDEQTGNLSGGKGRDWKTDIRAGGARMKIDRAVYPALLLLGGEEVVALDRDGAPAFEVLSVDTRSHLRLIVELGDK